MTQPPLVLASTSPRRRELLGILGLPFRQVAPPPSAEPPLPSRNFAAWAESAARAKALSVAGPLSSGIVVAADTIVIFQARCLGKPAEPQEAARWLMVMRGKEHQVITGVAVCDVTSARTVSSYTLTRVWMRPYSEDEVTRYIASGDPLDKAGAYAIQNPGFHPVERIDGCYYNVVGLPLLAVVQALAELGYDVGAGARAAIPLECQGCPTGVSFG